jgi:hypothetical protein
MVTIHSHKFTVSNLKRENKQMIRYGLTLAALAAFAATGIASVAPVTKTYHAFDASQSGSSTVYMTAASDAQVLNLPHKVVLQKCAVDDCSDTPQ